MADIVVNRIEKSDSKCTDKLLKDINKIVGYDFFSANTIPGGLVVNSGVRGVTACSFRFSFVQFQ